jgi:putative peptidoglycan lipid II flippase
MIAINQQPLPESEKPPPDKSSVGARIFRAALVVSLANILAKLLGLVRLQAVAYRFGAGDVTDAYWTVFNGIIMALFLIGEECIHPAFLPVFMEDSEKHGEKRAWRFASTVFNAQFLVVLLTVSFLMIYPSRVLSFLTDWETDPADAAKLATAADFLRTMAPALIGFSMGSLTFILLNARKKFFLASLGEGSWRAVFVAAVVVLGSERFIGQWALPVGVVAGSLAKICTHLPGLFRQLRHYRPVLALRNPQFRQFLLLITPLIAGSVFAKVRDLFNQVYVMSRVEAGLLTVNMMGRTFTDTLGFLVPYALSVGMFPYLCEMVDRGERRGIGRLLDSSSRLMLFFFLPIAAVMSVAAIPLSRLLFEMGKLKTADAKLIGLVTACYALALPAYGIERIMMKGFFSNKNTLSPFIVGIVWSSVSMLACGLLVVAGGWTGVHALLVVSLAYAITRVLKAITLVTVLKRTIPMLYLREVLPFLLRVLVLTVVPTFAAWAAMQAINLPLDLDGLTGNSLRLILLIHLGSVAVVATTMFLAVAWLLRMEELRTVADTIRPRATALLRKLRRRG